jgi:hypothetical protein
LNNLIQKMEPYTSEVANRLGIALSEAGGTISMGSSLLETYAADPTQTGEKLGVQGLADLFQTDAGKAFVEAAAAFNKHDNSAAKTTAVLQAAARKGVGFLLDDPTEKAKTVQRLVKSAARSYLVGMELLQWLAAAKHLPKWAAKLKANKALQPEAVQKWMRQPSEKKRLVAALVAAYEEQVDSQPKRAAQGLSDSEASPVAVAEAADSSSASQAGSSSTSDKKAKRNRSKKSSKKDKKKAKKDKKTKKKKSKKSNSSGSGSSSTKKNEKSGSESASPSTLRKRKAEPLDKKDKPKEKKEKRSGGEKPRTVKVYRITGATPDGKMLAKKTDVHDKVEIDDTTTVADVQLKLLTALGFAEDASNWSCKQLEDGKISGVAPDFPAKDLVGDIVLVKKGG